MALGDCVRRHVSCTMIVLCMLQEWGHCGTEWLYVITLQSPFHSILCGTCMRHFVTHWRHEWLINHDLYWLQAVKQCSKCVSIEHVITVLQCLPPVDRTLITGCVWLTCNTLSHPCQIQSAVTLWLRCYTSLHASRPPVIHGVCAPPLVAYVCLILTTFGT